MYFCFILKLKCISSTKNQFKKKKTSEKKKVTKKIAEENILSSASKFFVTVDTRLNYSPKHYSFQNFRQTHDQHILRNGESIEKKCSLVHKRFSKNSYFSGFGEFGHGINLHFFCNSRLYPTLKII